MSPLKNWAELMKEASEAPQKSGFTPLEPGIYSFVVKEPATIGKTNNGDDKFTINPSVEAGERANARVFHSFNVITSNPGVLQRYFFDDLAKLGLDASFFNTNPSNEQIAKALQGKRFTAEVFKSDSGHMNLRNFAPAGPPPASAQQGVPSPVPTAQAQAPAPQQQPQAAPEAPQAAQEPAQPQPPAQSQEQPQSAPESPWSTTPPPPAF